MATFPSGLITTSGLPVVATANPTNNPSHTAQHNTANGEIIAVEATLGINPQGTYSTVAAAISTLGTLVTTAQTTATAALTTAAGAVPKSAYTASGALLAGTGAGTYTALTTGTNGLALISQSTASGGLAFSSVVTTYPGVGVAVSPGTGGPWSSSLTVGTAAMNLVQLTATASQLPALSAALLTNLPTLFYVGAFTYAASSTANIVVTGTGFTPKAVIIVAAQSGATGSGHSIGMLSAVTAGCIAYAGSTTTGEMQSIPGYAIYYADTSGNNYSRAAYSAFGTNGFTLASSTSGSPSGTIGVTYLAMG